MFESPAFERLLKRDRVITLAGLTALCALAWLYIVTGAGLGMSAWEMTTLALFPHQQAHDVMPDGFEYAVAEIGSASSKTKGPVQVEMKDKYGQFARLHLNNHGVVRS